MPHRQPPDREPLSITVPSDLLELFHSGFHSSVPPLSAQDERPASGHDRTRRWGQFKTSQWGQFRASFSTCGSSTPHSPSSTHNYLRRSPTSIPSPAPGAPTSTR